jgi:hypothetical protein
MTKAGMLPLVAVAIFLVMLAPAARGDLIISPDKLSPPCAMPGAGAVTDCGTDTITLPFASIVSEGGNLTLKNLAGWTGIGVAGGYVNGEIDLANGETVTVHYVNPVTIPEFTLAFLFPSGQYGDKVFEVGIATANGLMNGTLTVTGPTTAMWVLNNHFFAATNLSPAVEPNAGVFQVVKPFGNALVTEIQFYPHAVLPGALDNTNSDFAIASVTAVPEPASIALFTTFATFVGLVVRRRLARV